MQKNSISEMIFQRLERGALHEFDLKVGDVFYSFSDLLKRYTWIRACGLAKLKKSEVYPMAVQIKKISLSEVRERNRIIFDVIKFDSDGTQHNIITYERSADVLVYFLKEGVLVDLNDASVLEFREAA
jgi:hypothetical protein